MTQSIGGSISCSAKVYSANIGAGVEILDFAVVYPCVTLGKGVVLGESSVVGRGVRASRAMFRDQVAAGPTLIGTNTIISAGAIVYCDVQIGDDCIIGDNASLFVGVQIGNSVLISRNVTINSEVKVGDGCRIMDNCHITGRSSLGVGVFLGVGVSSANDNSFGRNGHSDSIRGICVEDFASIGAGSVLLPGVVIGRGSIVSAGSVVYDSIPANSLARGNPCKVVAPVPKWMSRLPK